ncbi:MAG: hypothetical protein IPK83_22995 [Planctomycetes bacterium]|nr:hypothetical protein [Planctomycetota bacterium]
MIADRAENGGLHEKRAEDLLQNVENVGQKWGIHRREDDVGDDVKEQLNDRKTEVNEGQLEFVLGGVHAAASFLNGNRRGGG